PVSSGGATEADSDSTEKQAPVMLSRFGAAATDRAVSRSISGAIQSVNGCWTRGSYRAGIFALVSASRTQPSGPAVRPGVGPVASGGEAHWYRPSFVLAMTTAGGRP